MSSLSKKYEIKSENHRYDKYFSIKQDIFYFVEKYFLYLRKSICKFYLQNINQSILFFQTGFEIFLQVFYHEILFVKLEAERRENMESIRNYKMESLWQRYQNSYLSYFLMYNFYYLSWALFSALISVYLMGMGFKASEVSLVVSASFCNIINNTTDYWKMDMTNTILKKSIPFYLSLQCGWPYFYDITKSDHDYDEL